MLTSGSQFQKNKEGICAVLVKPVINYKVASERKIENTGINKRHISEQPHTHWVSLITTEKVSRGIGGAGDCDDCGGVDGAGSRDDEW